MPLACVTEQRDVGGGGGIMYQVWAGKMVKDHAREVFES